ncbi:ACT domain-containing protein [Apiosordaria backusii]|uniref:ACT domain-containing protein n=1 Tax=Apiosordaria backusii TaxID=314023 RepID=A0AA40EIR6_9PEZI|nr:ACT domain-containing protein [Apiosordaria backusii]
MALAAQITFLDGTLSLIHIPLSLYSTFLQPILRVLLPQSSGRPNWNIDGLTLDGNNSRHGFLNISVTPLECSIVCHTSWVKTVFEPVIRQLPRDAAKAVSISKDDYIVFSVTSAGMDAGSRVADLTSPLALANIPIFFITTYYTDFILVPAKDRQTVEKTLLSQGFVFSDDDDSSFTNHYTHSRRRSQSSGLNELPTTPPPSSIPELQERTFENLKKRNVVPYIEPELRLIHCSGKEDQNMIGGYSERPAVFYQHGHGSHHRNRHASHGPCWADTVDTKFYTALVSALVSQPRFLSITLAHEDPPSLLLDRTLLVIFGDSLVGPTTEGFSLVPIFLDLSSLPIEATGIVSGVAGTLVKELNPDYPLGNGGQQEELELSFLSTARAGAVILGEAVSARAMGVLRAVLVREGK